MCRARFAKTIPGPLAEHVEHGPAQGLRAVEDKQGGAAGVDTTLGEQGLAALAVLGGPLMDAEQVLGAGQVEAQGDEHHVVVHEQPSIMIAASWYSLRSRFIHA